MDAGDCVAVEGEPGIGKSRLLGELRARAEAHGDVVLAGAGAEFERDRPYGIWVDALDAYAASQAIEDRDLAGVLPSIGGDAPGGDERHRVHRAVGRLLGELAPLLLVLDDLHWADDASTELLGSLVRRGLAPGVQLALGYRTGRASPRLSATLAAPSVQVIELSTLSEADCRTLAGDLPADRQAVVFRESGGNPFYALQLARAAPAARSSSSDRVASGSGVPRSVAAALVGELEALTVPARALLDAGAIAGDPFDPELAYEIAGLDAETGVSALDELLETRLLHSTSVPRRFAFRHPLVRRAVYESTGGGWRLVAHARAAEALAARGASAASRAHHVEQSAAQGDPAAITVLLEAASTTAPRAPAAAARWFEAALRLQPEADGAARVQTLVALAQAQRSTGDLEACAARLAEAVELLGSDETGTRITLVAATATAEHFLGRHEAAERRLAEALDALSDRDSAEALTVLLAQVAGAFFTLDVAAGLALSETALAVATRLGDPLLVASTAAALAHSHANAGDVDGTRAALALAAPPLDAAGDDVVARHLESINRLAWSENLIEDDDDAIRHATRGIAIARATGQDQFVPMLAGALALSLVRNGDLAAAALIRDDALETAELAANDYVTSWVLTTSAHIAAAAGDLERSRRDAERALALVGGRAGRIEAMALARLAVTRRALGDRPEDTGALITALAPSWTVGLAEAMTRIELAVGRIDEAERFAELTADAGRRLGLPIASALAARAQAEVLLARGEAMRAAALAATASSSRPLENARSRAPRRARARAGRRASGRGPGAARRRARLRRVRRRARPRPGATGAAQAGRAQRAARTVGARHQRPRVALPPRARDRRARARPQDQPRDRGRAVPQREDDRDASAQRLRQARRVVAGRGRPHRRARRGSGIGPDVNARGARHCAGHAALRPASPPRTRRVHRRLRRLAGLRQPAPPWSRALQLPGRRPRRLVARDRARRRRRAAAAPALRRAAHDGDRRPGGRDPLTSVRRHRVVEHDPPGAVALAAGDHRAAARQ